MEKAEAITVLREILTACPEIGNADLVSLDIDNESVNLKGLYKITLRVNLDSQLRDCVQKILGTHKLKMTETKDLVVVYRPKRF